jgi:hypothetical protein
VSRTRQSLKALGIDIWIEDPRVEHAAFDDAHTPLGYDVVFVRVKNLLGRFRQGEVPFAERETVEGTPILGREAARALERVLARRRREFDEYLALGKTLVVVLGPPEEYAVYLRTEQKRDEDGESKPVRMHSRRTTVARAMPFEISAQASRGTVLQLATGSPFSEFWQEWNSIFHHELVLGHPGVTAVKTGTGNKAVAAIVEHRGGVAILLPDFDAFSYQDRPEVDDANPAHIDFVDALYELGERMKGRQQLPEWASTIPMPGEQLAQRRLQAARAKVDQWQREVEQRATRLQEIERRKGLITATGPTLERLVDEALTALGMRVEPGDIGRADRVVRLGSQVAVVEIKGQKGSAKEADAAQLTKWVASFHAAHGRQPKGILVVNAFNQTPLKDRRQAPFPDQMLAYAVDQQGYCLVTSEQLLALWLQAERDPRSRRALARSLLDCVGIYGGPGVA